MWDLRLKTFVKSCWLSFCGVSKLRKEKKHKKFITSPYLTEAMRVYSVRKLYWYMKNISCIFRKFRYMSTDAAGYFSYTLNKISFPGSTSKFVDPKKSRNCCRKMKKKCGPNESTRQDQLTCIYIFRSFHFSVKPPFQVSFSETNLNRVGGFTDPKIQGGVTQGIHNFFP